MALYNFHRVLIVAAGLFFLAFGVYLFRVWRESHGSGNANLAAWASGATPLAMGVVSLLVAVGSVGYLIYFNRRLRRQQLGEKV